MKNITDPSLRKNVLQELRLENYSLKIASLGYRKLNQGLNYVSYVVVLKKCFPKNNEKLENT